MPGTRASLMTLTADDRQLRQQLRRDMRRRRRALSQAEQLAASHRFANRLSSSLIFRRARHIGLYLAADGELDPLPALLGADNAKRTLYLPVLPKHADAVLHFVRWTPGEPLIANRYGIGEPAIQGRRLTPLWRLDLLLLPLVAFDADGNRLGMGAVSMIARWQPCRGNQKGHTLPVWPIISRKQENYRWRPGISP